MTQNKAISEDILWKLYNDYGCTELSVQATIDGFWTPRYKYHDLLHISPYRWVAKTYLKRLGRPMTRRELLCRVNHRSVVDIEVMLDIDDTEHDLLNFTTIKEKAKYIYGVLRKDDKDVRCYFTGNKSYHISYIEPMLRSMSRSMREKFKMDIIRGFYCDPGLAKENHMISLEYAEHYKSGKQKVEVDFDGIDRLDK